MKINIKKFRKLMILDGFDPDRESTHYEDCHKSHSACAYVRGANVALRYLVEEKKTKKGKKK